MTTRGSARRKLERCIIGYLFKFVQRLRHHVVDMPKHVEGDLLMVRVMPVPPIRVSGLSEEDRRLLWKHVPSFDRPALLLGAMSFRGEECSVYCRWGVGGTSARIIPWRR